ncbi:MAG TPA: hypothetical protein VJ967_04830 [Clostridia bacterium]|nr:hypothetical protein [Clostridia bacterium]
MFKLTFVIKKLDENTLALRLHWGFRAAFAVFAAIIFASMQVSTSQRGGGLIPTILIVLFAGIALYNESWYFHKQSGFVQHRHGLLLFAARKNYPASEIESLEVKAFRKGSVPGSQSESLRGDSEQEDSGQGFSGRGEKKRFFQKDLLTLSLVFSSGEKKDIEIIEHKNKAALQSKAAEISDFMGIPYHSEA